MTCGSFRWKLTDELVRHGLDISKPDVVFQEIAYDSYGELVDYATQDGLVCETEIMDLLSEYGV